MHALIHLRPARTGGLFQQAKLRYYSSDAAMHPRARQFVFCLMLLAVASLAAQEPARPFDPEHFLAHDSHQGVTIAARPVPDTPEAELIFGKKAAAPRAGFLPVELVIVNERTEPIEIALERVKILSDGDQFQQVDTETVALGLYPLPEPIEPKVGTGPRFPIPWPRGPKAAKDKKRAEREEAEAALRSRQLQAAVVAPGGRARGFLYFDLRAAAIDLSTAVVYLPEVSGETTGEGLLFFEISLKPYAKP